MSITLHVFYRGKEGAARAFADEMTAKGVVESIRREPGNLRYAYYYPAEDAGVVLLVDSWRDEAALDEHHRSPMMAEIAALREKYDLHMTVERFVSIEDGGDESFIRK